MSETYTEVQSAHEWRDPVGFWRALLICYLAAIILYVVLGAGEALVLVLYFGDLTIDDRSATILEQCLTTLNQAALPIFVVCVVTTLALQYRLVANAHVLEPSTKLTGPVLAIASYFIPLLGFFMPPLIMAELWRATFGADGRKPKGAIALWWSALIIGTFTGMFANFADAASWAAPRNAAKLYGASTISLLARAIAAGALLYIFGTLVKQQRATYISTRTH